MWPRATDYRTRGMPSTPKRCSSIATSLPNSPEGKHLRCKEIDSAGGFFECELAGSGPDGKPLDVDMLVPSSMIRLVVSVSGNEIDFGFS